jgi:hypothetical protein
MRGLWMRGNLLPIYVIDFMLTWVVGFKAWALCPLNPMSRRLGNPDLVMNSGTADLFWGFPWFYSLVRQIPCCDWKESLPAYPQLWKPSAKMIPVMLFLSRNFNLSRGDILRPHKSLHLAFWLVAFPGDNIPIVWSPGFRQTPCAVFEPTLWSGSRQKAPWAPTQGHSTAWNSPPAQRCRLSSETELHSLTEVPCILNCAGYSALKVTYGSSFLRSGEHTGQITRHTSRLSV